MEWRYLTGYYYEYRINEKADIQRKFPDGKWRSLSPYLNNKRAVINMWVTKTHRKPVGIVRLMDDAFFDGYARKNGMCIVHKNGAKMDCELCNLQIVTRKDCAKRSAKIARRIPVVKLDKQGNVIAHYKSCREAAKANFMSYTAMFNRVNNKIKDASKIDDFVYKFDR